jgi:hypothetical protein
MRVGPIRPAIVFEFAIGDFPARCRFGTEFDSTASRIAGTTDFKTRETGRPVGG